MYNSKIDFNSREQLYYQLYNILFQDIMNGKYKVGDMLPSEPELMEMYEVSRATVRRATEMLSNDGLIEKNRGLGTFVKSLISKKSPNRVVKYSKVLKGDKEVAYKKVLDISKEKSTKIISEHLDISDGDSIIKVKRLRYSDEKPMYLEINYYEEKWVPDLIDRDLSKESLRLYLLNHKNVKWSTANQKIYSILADEVLSELLNVPKDSPIIYIERISMDSNNVPREFVKTYYRADFYHIEIVLSID